MSEFDTFSFVQALQSAQGLSTVTTADAPEPAPERPGGGNNNVPRPKRIACHACRKMKRKCDSQRPRCGNCSRLDNECAYDEVRKKSGPKRGYVKRLESRLGMKQSPLAAMRSYVLVSKYLTPDLFFFFFFNIAEVEGALHTQKSNAQANAPAGAQENIPLSSSTLDSLIFPGAPEDPDITISDYSMLNSISPVPGVSEATALGQASYAFPDTYTSNGFQWEMIDLGYEEPLPRQDVIDELYGILVSYS